MAMWGILQRTAEKADVLVNRNVRERIGNGEPFVSCIQDRENKKCIQIANGVLNVFLMKKSITFED